MQATPVQRSITNPVSLSELSVQARLTWGPGSTVAVRFVGSAGGAGGGTSPVETMRVLETEFADMVGNPIGEVGYTWVSPIVLPMAKTRYQY